MKLLKDHLVIIITGVSILLLAILFIMQGVFLSYDKAFWSGILVNLIVSITFLLLTSFFIRHLVIKAELYVLKRKTYSIIGPTVDQLIFPIFEHLYMYLTKEPYEYSIKNNHSAKIKCVLNEIDLLISDIDVYVTKDFLKTPISAVIFNINNSSITKLHDHFQTQNIMPLDFHSYIHNIVNMSLNKIFHRYVSILNKEEIELLLNIEIALSTTFIDGSIYNIHIDSKKNNIDLDIENFKQNLLKSLNTIRQYFTHFEEERTNYFNSN